MFNLLYSLSFFFDTHTMAIIPEIKSFDKVDYIFKTRLRNLFYDT